MISPTLSLLPRTTSLHHTVAVKIAFQLRDSSCQNIRPARAAPHGLHCEGCTTRGFVPKTAHLPVHMEFMDMDTLSHHQGCQTHRYTSASNRFRFRFSNRGVGWSGLGEKRSVKVIARTLRVWNS